MIDLPIWPAPNGAEPYFLDAGGWQLPSIGGGNAVRIDRLGDRHGISVSMPPMRLRDDNRGIHAMEWISRLKRGCSEGVRIRFPQPGVTRPANATVRTATNAQATLIPVQGVPGTIYREGIFFSLVNATTGQRYLHSVNTQAVLDGAGQGTISVHPRTRIAAAVGWQLLFDYPTIEGRLMGEQQKWTLELARTVGLQFDIEEIG